MYEGKAIAVVVPAYNEADFVGTVIEGIPSFVDAIYPVDDASTDGTWEAIERAAGQRNASEQVVLVEDGGHRPTEPVVPLRHETNRGRGAAVVTGYRRALEDDADVVVVMDGDDQMDPAYLDRIIDPIVSDSADYVLGNRFDGRGAWDGMPPLRLFGSVLLTGLTRIASGYWHVQDSQNGYTAISAEMLRSMDLDGLYRDYGFLNDILVKLSVNGARVESVPIRARYGDEESGIRLAEFVPRLSALLLVDFLWRLQIDYLRQGRFAVPTAYGAGVTGMLVGVGRQVLRREPSDLRSNGLTFLVGVIAVLGAMVLDYIAQERK